MLCYVDRKLDLAMIISPEMNTQAAFPSASHVWQRNVYILDVSVHL